MPVMRFGGWLLALCLAGLAVPAGADAQADYASARAALERKQFSAARTQFEAAANAGDVRAMMALAAMLGAGQGGARDEPGAFVWHERAAEGGHAPAQATLSTLYASGRGVAADAAQSLVWARRAAENGDAQSQHVMGIRSRDGLGVPRDIKQALLWFGAAAEQGHAPAQYSFGQLLADAAAESKNAGNARNWRELSYQWLWLAREGGVGAAKLGLMQVGSLLTSEQITRVEREAREWKPVQFGGVAPEKPQAPQHEKSNQKSRQKAPAEVQGKP